MNLKSLTAALLFASTSFLAVACGGADDVDPADGESNESDVIQGKVTPGSFKLYAEADHVPSPGCDLHTKLTLAASPRSTATLVEAVDGFCEIAVAPNERSYRLRLTGTSCGSKIWTGSRTANGARTAIKITDHRSRMCMDLVAGLVEVEETLADGTVVKKYGNESAPQPPPSQAIEVTGKLFSSFGIGGENTGRSIRTADKTYELVLDASEAALFSENATARVRGTLTFLSGVETQNRPAIDVTEILACPKAGYVNCMPPTQNPLCASDTRGWVQASCPGVDYLD